MGTWQLDPYHTQIEFATKHLGFMTVRGHFLEVALTSHIDGGANATWSRSNWPAQAVYCSGAQPWRRNRTTPSSGSRISVR